MRILSAAAAATSVSVVVGIALHSSAKASWTPFAEEIAALQSGNVKKIHRRAVDMMKEHNKLKWDPQCFQQADYYGSCTIVYHSKYRAGRMFEVAGDKTAALNAYQGALAAAPYVTSGKTFDPPPRELSEIIARLSAGEITVTRESHLATVYKWQRETLAVIQKHESDPDVIAARRRDAIAAREESNRVLGQALENFSQGMQQIAANNIERRRQQEVAREEAARAREAESAAALAASNQALAESNRRLAEQQRAYQQQQSATQQQSARLQPIGQQQAAARQPSSQSSSSSGGESRNTASYSFMGRSSMRLDQGYSVWDLSITNHTNRELQCRVQVQGSMYGVQNRGPGPYPRGLTNSIAQSDIFSPGQTKRYSVVASAKGSWAVSGCTVFRTLDRMPNVPLHRITVDN